MPLTAAVVLDRIDAIIGAPPYPPNPVIAPNWGWHDDHRYRDGTSAYLPALMQVRSEYAALLDVLATHLSQPNSHLFGGAALQLGMGHLASHLALAEAFDQVVSIDLHGCASADHRYHRHLPGVRTDDPAALLLARTGAPYDLLLIDAGHSYDDARHDHRVYAPLVRPGGIVAFHDALRRPAFPEVEVWRYLETLDLPLRVIGREVGFAWYQTPS